MNKTKFIIHSIIIFIVIFSAYVFILPEISWAATYYVSPTGNNNENGLTEFTAWKTFSKAFSIMVSGDELILLDGTYSEAAGTGYVSYLGTNSGQIPSGTGLDRMTYVHAKNPGKVIIIGRLFIGRSTRKDSYIKIQGITFEGGGSLYNTSYVTIKECGFHDESNGSGNVFGIGTNDHSNGNSYNLIEDVWIWGRNRIIAINYRSDHNVWRRIVVRGDGCNSVSCTGSGNPNVGITVYDSSYISLQNVIVVDRILDSGSPYSDFAVAQHTPDFPHGNNEWLGTISLKAPDSGYYMEPDNYSLSPTHKLVNCVAWDSSSTGINLARTGYNTVENCTLKVLDGDGIRIAPELSSTSGILRNIIVVGNGRYGINSGIQPSYTDLFGTWSSGTYNQTTCSVGCKTTDPLSGGSLKYVLRIENGSALKGAGFGGIDYGANIEYRYGVDGSRFDDANYNTLTGIPLWPWPNEDRIKIEMCASETRGFCSASTLTKYIWEYLGNSTPAEIYGTAHAPDTTPPSQPTGLMIQ